MALSDRIISTNPPQAANGTPSRPTGINNEIKLTRWRGGQHPTMQIIRRKMEQEGLRPYAWSNGPNFRLAARSHGYTKIIYCVEGSLELALPDINQTVVLRPGDRLELPCGVRHAAVTGARGAQCLESAR